MKRSVASRVTEIWKIFTGCHGEEPRGITLNDYGLDSLDRVDLMVQLESEFNIWLKDGAEDDLGATTRPQMIRFIKSKVKKGSKHGKSKHH